MKKKGMTGLILTHHISRHTRHRPIIIPCMTVIPQQHGFFRFYFHKSSANPLKNVKSSRKYQERNVTYVVRFL